MTPSLSIGATVRARSHLFTQVPWFEAESLAEHIGFYLRVLTGTGLDLADLRVRVTLAEPDGEGMLGRLQERDFEPLARRFPDVELGPDPDPRSGRGYYIGVRFQIHVSDGSVDAHLADGGFTRWTQALLSDRKERLLTSGIGPERLYRVFGSPTVDTRRAVE